MALVPVDDLEIPEDPLAMPLDLTGAAFPEPANRYCSSFLRSISSPRSRAEQSKTVRKLGEAHPALSGFCGINELLDVLQDKRAEFARKDEILLSLVRALQSAPSSGALQILLVAMLPCLLTLYGSRLKSSIGETPDEVFAGILSAFSDACAKYPIERRPGKVAGNLAGETKRFHSKWRAVERRVRIAKEKLVARVEDLRPADAPRADDDADRPTLPPDISGEVSADPGVMREILDEFAGTESTEAPYSEDELDYSRHLVGGYERGHFVDAAEAELLHETYVLDRPIEEIAAKSGEKPETVRKRRDRAATRIRSGKPRIGKRKRAHRRKKRATPTCTNRKEKK